MLNLLNDIEAVLRENDYEIFDGDELGDRTKEECEVIHRGNVSFDKWSADGNRLLVYRAALNNLLSQKLGLNWSKVADSNEKIDQVCTLFQYSLDETNQVHLAFGYISALDELT